MQLELELDRLTISSASRKAFTIALKASNYALADLYALRTQNDSWRTKISWIAELLTLDDLNYTSDFLPSIWEEFDCNSVSAQRCYSHILLEHLRAKNPIAFAVVGKNLNRLELALYNDSPVAVQSYAIYMLYHLGFVYPEAHQILLEYIENYPLHEKPAVRMACRKTYQALKSQPERAVRI